MRIALIGAFAAALIGAAAAQETKEPIKLGAIEVLTGPNNRYGIPVQRAFDLAIEEINKAGGVLGGRPIAIAYEDSAGNKDQAMNAARKLIGRDKVPLILGPTLSNEMFAVGPVVNDRKIPIIGTSTTANGITAIGPWVFRTAMPESDVIPVTLKTAKEKLGVKKVVVMYANDDAFTKSAYDVMKDSLTKLGGEGFDTKLGERVLHDVVSGLRERIVIGVHHHDFLHAELLFRGFESDGNDVGFRHRRAEYPRSDCGDAVRRRRCADDWNLAIVHNGTDSKHFVRERGTEDQRYLVATDELSGRVHRLVFVARGIFVRYRDRPSAKDTASFVDFLDREIESALYRNAVAIIGAGQNFDRAKLDGLFGFLGGGGANQCSRERANQGNPHRTLLPMPIFV